MKVALVHYWLTSMRGGEKVLEAFCELYPDADIFTLVADSDKLSPTLKKHKITTSFLQRMGGVKHYQKMLPLMPMALESFDLTPYDLVISSEAGPAKGIVTRPDAMHVCYCHSPMRYIWDLYPQYYQSAGPISRLAMKVFFPGLRVWDVTTSARVDHFIANSEYVQKRIARYYRRESTIINPPVNVTRFAISDEADDYYLCCGQITPYKKIEIAIEAFTRNGKRLVVVGAGASRSLKRAAGPNIKFVGSVDDAALGGYLSRCRALVFPGVEDFGIVPLEAMASGRPVIAFARGGALETVKDGKTGILFHEQTTESLMAAVERMELTHHEFSPQALRDWAMGFERSVFVSKLRTFMARLLAGEGAAPRLAYKESRAPLVRADNTPATPVNRIQRGSAS